MTTHGMSGAIRAAGAIWVGLWLPTRLKERLAGVPRFLRQIFYVDWIYIVLLLGMFAGVVFWICPRLVRGRRPGAISERIHGGVLGNGGSEPVWQ